MSTINVSCTDQVLAITNSPVLASGGQHENKIAFNFCELWTGYAKTCMFYQQKGNVIFTMIDANDECEIPAAATADAGRMYFGVLGVNANGVTRTSAILSYRIVEGTITEVEDPDPSVYQQILAELAALRTTAEGAEAWAVGKRNGVDVPSTDPTYHNNAKYYSETVAGVGSFNGRTGVVVPAAGDYTPDMVGASCRRNLLDNWYFGNPVNQREVSGTISTAGYFLDRWKLTSGSVTINSGSITLNGTMVQILENAIGQSVTATVLTDTGVSDVVPTYDDTTHTLTITASGKTIIAVKLETGSGQTLAHQEGSVWVLNEIPDYDYQLHRCRLFYQRIKSSVKPLGFGRATSSTLFQGIIMLESEMRNVTSATFNTHMYLYGNGTEKSNISTFALYGSNKNTRFIYVQATSLSGLNTHDLYDIEFNIYNGKIEFFGDL